MQEASRLITESTEVARGTLPAQEECTRPSPGDSDAFTRHSECDHCSSRCNGLQLTSPGPAEPAGSGPPAWAQLGRDAGDSAGTPASTGTLPGVAPRGATRASAAGPGLCLDRGGRSRRKLDRIPPAQAQEGSLRATGRPASRRYGRGLPGLRHSTRNSDSRGLTQDTGASPPAPSGGRAAPSPHSARMAASGSTRAACLAGTNAATPPARASTVEPPAQGTGSSGLTPYSSRVRSLVAITPSAPPAASPPATSRTPSRRTRAVACAGVRRAARGWPSP